MPAEQYFNQFSDYKSLKTEQQRILALFGEISDRMKTLSKQGVKINFANSIKEMNAAIKELERTNNTLSVLRKEYTISTAKIITMKQSEAKATRDSTKASADEKVVIQERNKQLLLEARVRQATSNSIEEYNAKIALLEFNLKKLDTQKESDLIIQDSINKQIVEYNRLIDEQAAKGAPSKSAGAAGGQTPIEDIPFTHNLDELEKEREALKNTGDAVNELNEAEADAAMTANEWAAAQRNAADATEDIDASKAADGVVEYKDELERLTGSLSENEELLSLHRKELADVQSEMKLLEKTTSTSEKSTDEYQKRMEALRGTETKLKAEIKELNGTIKQQTIETNAAKGSLDQLKARYILLTREIDRLGDAGRKTDLGRRLIAEASQVQTSIKKVEAETGRFQRNVGNYSSAVGAAFSKTYSFLKQAAAAIPGFGLAGLIGLAIGPLVEWIQKLTNTMVGFKKAQADIKASIGESTAEAMKEVGVLKSLYEITQDTTQSLDNRKEATKRVLEVTEENNKRTGDHIKFETDANGILIKNTAQYGLLVDSMLKYAKTKGYLNLISKAYEELAKAETASLESQTTAIGDAIRAVAGQFTGDFGGIRATIGKAILNKEESIKNAKEYVEGIEKTFKEKLASGELTLDGVFDAKKSGGAKAIEDYADDLAKILAEINKDNFEALKKRREDEIKTLEEITNDTKRGYFERYAASQNFYDKSRELITINAAFELAQAKKAVEEEKRKVQLELNKKGLNTKQKKDLNDTLLALDVKLAADEKVVQQKSDSESLALDKTSEKQRTDLRDSESEKRKKIIEDERKFEEEHAKNIGSLDLERIENEYDAAQQALDDRFNNQLISEKEYNRKKLRLEAERQIATIESEINTTVALIEEQEKRFAMDENELQHKIDIAKAEAALEQDPAKKKDKLAGIAQAEKELTQLRVRDNDVVAQSVNKLNALFIKLNSIRLNLSKKTNKESKDDFLKTFKDISDAARMSFELIGGLISASTERDKNRIQGQIDLLEQQRQKDIEVAEQTITNAQDRAAAITAIDSKANAQRKQYEIEQRQAEERSARFQKAATISQIVLATALAVITALKEGDPFTKIPRAIAAGAIGAAQLAVAIATPIPKYGTGTDNAEEGPALIAEQGRELEVRPDGKIYLHEKPTVTNLIGGTKIIKNSITEDILRANRNPMPIAAPKREAVRVPDRSGEVVDQLKKLNKKPPVNIVLATPIELSRHYQFNMKE